MPSLVSSLAGVVMRFRGFGAEQLWVLSQRPLLHAFVEGLQRESFRATCNRWEPGRQQDSQPTSQTRGGHAHTHTYYIYIYIYITHTHIYIYIYIYITHTFIYKNIYHTHIYMYIFCISYSYHFLGPMINATTVKHRCATFVGCFENNHEAEGGGRGRQHEYYTSRSPFSMVVGLPWLVQVVLG